MTLSASEVEILRKAIICTNPHEDICAAVDILDRLSPPEPEQPDEATRIWREMNARGFNALADHESAKGCLIGDYDSDESAVAEISYLRTVLSELIASKDAEIAKAQLWAMEQHKCADEYASELAALRAEKSLLLSGTYSRCGTCDTVFELQGAHDCKAAECNPAGPGPWPGDPDHRETMPVDTAPVVEVTQADRDAADRFGSAWRMNAAGRFGLANLLGRHRTEAEARGRREALEEALLILRVHNASGAIVQIERLMTEVK